MEILYSLIGLVIGFLFSTVVSNKEYRKLQEKCDRLNAENVKLACRPKSIGEFKNDNFFFEEGDCVEEYIDYVKRKID